MDTPSVTQAKSIRPDPPPVLSVHSPEQLVIENTPHGWEAYFVESHHLNSSPERLQRVSVSGIFLALSIISFLQVTGGSESLFLWSTLLGISLLALGWMLFKEPKEDTHPIKFTVDRSNNILQVYSIHTDGAPTWSCALAEIEAIKTQPLHHDAMQLHFYMADRFHAIVYPILECPSYTVLFPLIERLEEELSRVHLAREGSYRLEAAPPQSNTPRNSSTHSRSDPFRYAFPIDLHLHTTQSATYRPEGIKVHIRYFFYGRDGVLLVYYENLKPTAYVEGLQEGNGLDLLRVLPKSPPPQEYFSAYETDSPENRIPSLTLEDQQPWDEGNARRIMHNTYAAIIQGNALHPQGAQHHHNIPFIRPSQKFPLYNLPYESGTLTLNPERTQGKLTIFDPWSDGNTLEPGEVHYSIEMPITLLSDPKEKSPLYSIDLAQCQFKPTVYENNERKRALQETLERLIQVKTLPIKLTF